MAKSKYKANRLLSPDPLNLKKKKFFLVWHRFYKTRLLTNPFVER